MRADQEARHDVPAGTGYSTPRLEDARLVTGTGQFVSGLVVPDMLHACFVRTAEAHGSIVRVGTSDAQAADGVAAVFTAADLELHDIPGGDAAGARSMARPPLARDRVRYVGEPIAVVVAASQACAIDAAELVSVTVDRLPCVSSIDEAVTDETVLFAAAGSNTVATSDLVAPRVVGTAATVVAEVTIDDQRLAPVTLEPLSIVVEPVGDGLTVWCGNQAPHRLQRQLAQMVGIDPARLRVRSPDVGGSFGLRGRLHPEYGVIIAAARELGRPVSWVQSRTEQFLAGTHGRGMRHRVRLTGDRTGRIHAARIEIVADVGAYPHNGAHVPGFAAFMAPGAYDVPIVECATRVVVTNRAPIGSYRGAGRPEATFAIERAVDRFAVEAGLDPAEVRRTNLLTSDRMPHRTATGAAYDSGDYTRAFDRVLELVDEPAVRRRQVELRETGGRPLGLGAIVYVERAGGGVESSEYAQASFDRGGGLTVAVGSAAAGQGHDTVWAQLAASLFGLRPRDVRILTGDVAQVARGVGSFGSRSAQVGGSAVHRACRQLRDELCEVAADLFAVDTADVVIDRGAAWPAGELDRAVAMREIVAHAADRGRELRVEELFSPGAQTFPYGAVAAVVEVDTDTGRIGLERLVMVDDSGTVLHPQIAEGQIHGSLAQGVGQALYEAVEYDEIGQLRTATLVDYLVPGPSDLPPFETDSIRSPAPSNPLGAKGVGEAGCLGAPPAIVNATLDALRHLGVRELQMPMTPEHVWRAIQTARRHEGEG